jgi:hypothetical protein
MAEASFLNHRFQATRPTPPVVSFLFQMLKLLHQISRDGALSQGSGERANLDSKTGENRMERKKTLHE